MIELNFDELTKDDLIKVNNQKIKLVVDNLDFYILLHLKENNENLLVHSNGAIDLNKSTPPVFLRNSWREEFDANCLFIDDRTIHNSKVSLGWGLGTKDRYYVEDYARISQKIAELLEIKDPNVTYYGSSGGGFISLMLATLHKNSCAVVNNPQAYVHRYSRNAVLKAYHLVFGEEVSFDEVNKRYADRLSSTALMKKCKHVPLLFFIQNRLSKSDMENHVNPFMQMLDKYNLDSSKINFLFYNDKKSGHSPLPKDKTVEIVNLIINKELNIY